MRASFATASSSVRNSPSGMAYNGTSTCASREITTRAQVGFLTNVQPSRAANSVSAASTTSKNADAALDGFSSLTNVSGR